MARKLSKNVKIAKNLTSKVDILPLQEAIDLAKKASFAKFDESLDIAINLNLDTRKSDQQLRGAVVLPNGNGKSVRVLVATDDVNAQKAAKAAGADLVYSAAELPEILNQDKYEFDVIVADPKMMLVLGKKGKANYRADKGGIIHSSIGKKSMDTKKLTENAEALIQVIKRLKPTTVKGTYVKNITVSTSMGPSVKVKID